MQGPESDSTHNFMMAIKVLWSAGLLLIGAFGANEGFAANARMTMSREDTNTLLQVQGDIEDEWRFQVSSNLST